MDAILHQLNEVTILSTTVRLLLAVLLGGVIGLERGAKNRPAGFRTHILVCTAACLAMLTNQYVFENMTELADPTRLGAQVITGVGFLGVGTILVTGKQKIKGLTTAAGLWASACMGLAVGIGFYGGAILAGVIFFFALFAFGKIERIIESKSRSFEIYVEFESLKGLQEVRKKTAEVGITIHDTHFSQSNTIIGSVGLYMLLSFPKDIHRDDVIGFIEGIDGVQLVEDL